ncbi:hypothetical protein ABWK50_30165, partial [Priestia megaterium]|uniref:hypothetical protein n=1 Tax=Priestia megaterium TaxID=1404 RepID=UPI003396A1B8
RYHINVEIESIIYEIFSFGEGKKFPSPISLEYVKIIVFLYQKRLNYVYLEMRITFLVSGDLPYK